MGTRIGLWLLAVCLVAATVQAEPLRYRWAAEGQFVYDIEITADLPDAVETLTGKIVYQVKSTGEPSKISYRGGLTKATKKKPGSSSGGGRGPFDDLFGRPPGFASPFSRQVNPFKGLEQTTNEVVVSSTGSILAMEGSSQLPYLLGNLSLLVFEPLSETEQANWKVESGVAITEKKDRSESFGPFDPFARGGGPDKTIAAGQSTSFAKESEQGGLSSFKRTFRLNSPGDDTSFSIDGTGRWVFNNKLGMSESLDFQQKLSISKNNVSLVVPVSIKYRRLSNEEWEKMEQERIEAAKAKTEQSAREAAIAKAMADAPLSPAERQQILAAVRSANTADLSKTLKDLGGKTSRPDEELAKALQPLLTHSDKGIQDLAKAALAVVSPVYKLKRDLDRAYESANEAKVVGLWVTYDTPLPKGLVVAANSYHRGETKYFPATIEELLADGLVKVRYRHMGGSTEDRLREDMFLAPEEVEQPQLSPDQLAELQAYRERVKQELANSPDGPEATERLIRSYRDGHEPVAKVGAPIPDDLPLPKYMVVAAKKDGKWYQARVSSVQPNGRVSVRYSSERVDASIPRADLRLPPPEVKAPNVPPPYQTSPAPSAPSSTAGDAFRVWTDSTGKFKVEAKFVSSTADAVRIVRKDGKELTIPLNRLSDTDRQLVVSLKKSENPFEVE